MKKSMILLGMLSIGYAYAQEGNVGINIEAPKATLHIQPNAENLTKTTNEGIIAPKLTKERIAGIADANLVEGTLVYATDATYAGTNTKVAKITEKGYYFYNGTEWVKVQYNALSSSEGSKWTNDTTNNTVKLTNLSDGTTARDNTKNIIITDNGNVGIGQMPDSKYRLDVPDTSRFKDIISLGWITQKFSQPILHQLSNSTANSSILFNQMWDGAINNYAVHSNDAGSSYVGQLYYRANDGQLGFRLTTQKLEHGAPVTANALQRFLLLDGVNKNVRIGNIANTFQTNQRSLIVEHENGSLGIYKINGATANAELGKIDLGVRLSGLYETIASIKAINERNSYAGGGKIHQLGGALTFSTAKVVDDIGNEQTTPEEHMRITSIGNIGIGTNQPTEKLEVSGKIKTSSLAGTGDRVVYADENGILKVGSAVSTKASEIASTTAMECNADNRGKMNFIPSTDNAKSDVFGICMRNKDGNYYWAYMVGGNNPTNGTGAFGSGL